ncbi:MAG: hypothetical protein HQ521_14745 [Bacteroidetes bacterium]|nr:hypothetical protein [Bacteroidota bacterium]
MFFQEKYTYRFVIVIVLLLLTQCVINAQIIDTIPSNDTIFSVSDTSVARSHNNIADTSFNIIDTISSIDSSYYGNESSNILIDSILSPIDSLIVYYFEGTIENLKLNNFSHIDTNTYDFQRFDPLNVNNGLYSTLSNIGLAANNLVYTPTLSTGYYLGSSVFTNYIYHNDKVEYYKLFVPYTELNYVMGSKKEQNLNIVFTRKIFDGFTFGLDFTLNNSPPNRSPYLRSAVNDQRFYFTSQYYTKNKRYGVIANYLNNTIDVQENGGIEYDSIFTDNIEPDRRIIPINLADAQNKIKQSGFFIEQYFNILGPENKNDSVKRKIEPGNISYSFRYRRNRMFYSDNSTDSSFYFNNLPPLDSVSTFDSLTQVQIENTFRWSNIGYHENPKDKIFYMFLGASHNYITQQMPYDSVKTSYSQLTAFGGVAFNFGRSFHLSGNANYVFGDYNQDDYSVTVLLEQYLGTKERNIGYLNFGLDFTNKTPNWYYNNYQSNYYRWSNNLKKEKYLILSGSYHYKQLSAGAKFFTIENYTYINDSIRPMQIEKAETMLQVFAEGTIPLNKFGINTRVVYQTTSQPNIIRFPSITGTIDIYFRSPIFKKAAILQTGFQVMYFSEYYADAYMPELRLFYVQDKIKIGNYPYADFYLTLMVKRARLFFKMAHFNSYLGNYNYFLAPNYPARDARFYFGASWRFHD